MKLAILTLIFPFFLTACSNSHNKNVINPNADTSKIDAVDTAAITASKIAYGKVNFRISKKEFNRLMPEPFEGIAGEMYKVSANFDNGKLYLLDFLSISKRANYFDNLKISLEEFARLIKSKYGSPSKDYGDISFLELEPERVRNKYIWNIHTKTIQLGIYKHYGGGEYSIYCTIFDQPTFDLIQNKREVENDSIAKAQSKNF